MGNESEERRPIKTPLDQTIQDLRAVNNLVKLGCPLLRRGDFWFDCVPFRLGDVQLTLDLEGLVGIPTVIDKKNRAEEAEGDDAELERIALSLAFLGDFFV